MKLPRVLWEGEAPPLRFRCRIVQADDGEGGSFIRVNYLGTNDLDEPTWYRLEPKMIGTTCNLDYVFHAAVLSMHEMIGMMGKPL